MNSTRRRAEWQIVLWGVFGVCLVGAGALPLSHIRNHRVVQDQSPYSSTNAVLRSELGLENGASAIMSALAHLPKGTPISVVYCSTSVQALPGLVTTQVLWSRNVEEFRCSSPFGADLDVPGLVRRGGVAVFVSLPPPAELGEITTVGTHINIVRLSPRP